MRTWNSLKDFYNTKKSNLKSLKLEKLLRHLWYLHKQLACLSLFDPEVTREDKLKIVQSLKNGKSVPTEDKRLNIKKKDFDSLAEKQISDIVSKESLFIFTSFGLSHKFIENDPECWDTDPDYKECLKTFSCLKAVNDTAERGVALIQKYNDCLTRDEDQRQYILQIVHEHRKNYPSCIMSAL